MMTAAAKFAALENRRDSLILGLESSCDETAAAVTKGKKVLSRAVSTQIDIHRRYGGVVPEVASRNHTIDILPVVDEALEKAGLTLSDLDAVAVTYGAGLMGGLLVGVATAKALCLAADLPLVKVNHLEAHIAAAYAQFPALEPPFFALVASGGHTCLYDVAGYNDYRLTAGTLDDAIGEAFDKVARLLGLPYPGGPEIDRLAVGGKANIDFFKTHRSGRPLSYSGLKTAVVNYIHTLRQRGEEPVIADVCASFSKCAVDSLAAATVAAAAAAGRNRVVMAGGVAANTYLRRKMSEETAKKGLALMVPDAALCTDNGVMVAVRGFLSAFEGRNLAGLDLGVDSGLI